MVIIAGMSTDISHRVLSRTAKLLWLLFFFPPLPPISKGKALGTRLSLAVKSNVIKICTHIRIN